MEKFKDVIESGDFNPIVGVTGNREYALIILTLENPSDSPFRDVLIKDIKSSSLLPVLIQGTSGDLAMDR